MKQFRNIVRKSVFFVVKNILGAKIVAQCDYKKLSTERCIIACNHMSNFDPPIIGCLFPTNIHFLAKEELFRFKPLAWLITSLNAISIRRGVVDKNAIQNINNVLNKDEAILIFPEGSRKSFKAKPGIGLLAMNTKSRVLPIYMENSNHLCAVLFRLKKLTIYIGDSIEPSVYADMPLHKDSYRTLSKDILDKINGLKLES